MDYLQTSFLDTTPSSPSSGTPTLAPSCESGPQTVGSPACMCTKETCECSIHPPGRAEWIASMRDSLVRTLAPLAKAQASATEPDLVCGERLSAWPVSFDRDSSCWRTAQESLIAESMSYSGTWPRSGTMLDGVCWALPMSEPRTSDIGGGVWPTPTKTDASERGYQTSSGYGHKYCNPTLAGAARIFPMPCATDWKTPYRGDALRAQLALRAKPLRDAISAPVGTKLNPQWVAWLMGWPIMWTRLHASATAKSRSARQLRGVCSEAP